MSRRAVQEAVALPDFTAYLVYALRLVTWSVRSLLRAPRSGPDFVVLLVDGAYPELPARRPRWQRWVAPAPPTMCDLAERMRAIAGDARVRGIVLHLRHLDMPFARLEDLRSYVADLRANGKDVIAYASTYDTRAYYVACAADRILVAPGGAVLPLGLSRSYYFLADALARIGLRFDVVPISPYKSAGDALAAARMSDELREMAGWLIDAEYAEFVSAICAGRRRDDASARGLVDGSPYTDLEALEAGAIDGIVGEEDLPSFLGTENRAARLAYWSAARGALRLRRPGRPGRSVALLRIEGTIVDGESARPLVRPPVDLPLVTDLRAGDLTVVQAARRALVDRRIAAAVVYIDSRGGSATASESMAAALARLAASKPVVVAMGAVAASGGYYAATPAAWIVAQPSTITGSIGVIFGKMVDEGLLAHLRAHREILERGENAGFWDGDKPFTAEERRVIQRSIERVYDVFVGRVVASRLMDRDAVEAIARGRVWTGRQAMARGLVDELGGIEAALRKARALGGLDARAPVREIVPGRGVLAPASPAGALAYAMEGAKALRRARALCVLPFTWDGPA